MTQFSVSSSLLITEPHHKRIIQTAADHLPFANEARLRRAASQAALAKQPITVTKDFTQLKARRPALTFSFIPLPLH